MSTSSEEVLLIVNKVKHKKSDGSLYLMGERLAWMMDSKDSFTISYHYTDIKVQKISPDTKDKVQLQIVMHDGSACTFHFNNPQGQSAQQKDRNDAKELLQQLLPKHRSKINTELEHKNRMLQEDPELFQLYKDLVVSQVITADEFWANRTQNESRSEAQPVGVSAAFLSEVKPQSDGCNGLRYNLTADIIESIFRTYPAVKQKHKEHVPGKLSESEFWTKFFQSHYFHRDRINFNSKDVFSDCAKKDEEGIRNLREKIEASEINLEKTSDTTLDEGYGTKTSGSEITNEANLSMIKRFNHHSTRILEATNQPRSSPMVENSVENGESSRATVPAKKMKLPDLPDLQKEDRTSHANLNLSNINCYLHGPTPLQSTVYKTNEDMVQASEHAIDQLQRWKSDLTETPSSSVTAGILSDLSPGGIHMQSSGAGQLQHMMPTEIQQEFRQLYSAAGELLRHFWSCFPVTSKALEEKAMKMKTNLERFKVAKLNFFKHKVEGSHYSANLTQHLEQMLDAAFIKYINWQAKRKR